MPSSAREVVEFLELRGATFRHTYAEWLARHERPTEVLYRLPKMIRQNLAVRPRHGRPILEATDIAAEDDFDAMCLGFFAEGTYQGWPVSYRLLQAPPKRHSAEELKQMGLNFNMEAVKRATKKVDDLQLRIKGYVGRLLTDLSFLQARNDLRAVWLVLPERERPAFPLSRTTVPLGPTSQAIAHFQALLDTFCERYSLQSMATWELPDPVGPLLGGGPWPAHILKSRQVVIAVPSHFSILDKDELVEVIRNQQQMHVREAGIDPTCIGPRSAETYSHIFEIDHYERVVIARYGCRPRPKGFISQLNEGLMAHLDIGPDHLRSLRQALAAFKRGMPHTGKWTR
jgi:hypothetical protein